MTGEWTSVWISPGHDLRKDLGVFMFRRAFTVAQVPQRVDVRVSADQRYKLYANGALVGFGPQRGDIQHWFYDSYDIAPFLRQGANLIQAIVWNFGGLAPMAQISARTAFLLDDFEFEELSSGESWEVARLDGWDYAKPNDQLREFYVDVGPSEIVDAALMGGPTVLDAKLDWRKPATICSPCERGAGGGGTPWMLIHRSIPPMRCELRSEPPVVRRDFEGDRTPAGVQSKFTHGEAIELKSGETVLFDYGELLCAYPDIAVAGEGKLVITYAESLWQSPSHKGNRDAVAGKAMRGYWDEVALCSQTFTFQPLWWRTYRYLLIQSTGGTARIESVDAIETGYPLEVESSFKAADSWVRPIWDISIRTAKRCAGETYFDCPYYEQLQYAGDTRIQALIGYYLGRDRELQRTAVRAFHWSLMDTGLTQSRYPSRQPQVIPPFSLWYLAMLSDQRLYDRVGPASEEQESCVERIDAAFTNLLMHPEHSFWNFADWVPTWHAGVPPGGIRAMVHRLTQFYCKLLNLSARYDGPDDSLTQNLMEAHFSDDVEFERLEFEQVFQKTGGLIREEGERPSEHAEALYRLCQIELGLDPDPWPFSGLERENAAKCTYYFSYYKHLAMQPDDYISLLEPWWEMIEDGLTTFAENPDPVRSDCHAWSAHPILGFFQIVAGVKSIVPGWRKCRIQPRPGRLERFDAKIAHPDGLLRVAFEGGKLTIDSPVPYELIWKGRADTFREGKNAF